MGFKPKRQLVKLTFEDPELAGLEVTTRSVSMEVLVAFTELAEVFEGRTADDIKTADLRKIDDLYDMFARVLVSWNVERDDDSPCPTDVEGLREQDFEFVLALILAWIQGMTQAPPPLPGGLPSGGTSPAVPIPMTPLAPAPSPSPPS